MKTTFKKAGVMGALSIVAFGAISASAMGFGGGFAGMSGTALTADEIATRHTTLFTQQASMIGASVDEVKNAWASGKDFATLAKEKGITAEQLAVKLQAQRTTQMKDHLATLVSKGVITQAQADARLTFVQNNQNTKGHMGGKQGMRGAQTGTGTGTGTGLGGGMRGAGF
jgi:hypothetical protein